MLFVFQQPLNTDGAVRPNKLKSIVQCLLIRIVFGRRGDELDLILLGWIFESSKREFLRQIGTFAQVTSDAYFLLSMSA